MPKIQYVEPRNMTSAILTRIDQANVILEDLARQGYSITLRQLYYQFVARGFTPNTMRDYKNLGQTISDARQYGLIDWNLLEDRTRNLRGVAHWNTPADIIEASARDFRLDKWKGQAHRVEVWVEKDALVGVVERATRGLDVDYFSCRGYVSQSEMWAAAQRHISYEAADQSVTVLHLGDHDPSGMQMSEDMQDRLYLYGAQTDLRRIALTMDQIEALNPPPNPAKIKDSRAKKYIDEYGPSSWELDALNPAVLDRLIRDEVAPYRDEKAYAKAQKREANHRETLANISTAWEEVEAFAADGFPDVSKLRYDLDVARDAARDATADADAAERKVADEVAARIAAVAELDRDLRAARAEVAKLSVQGAQFNPTALDDLADLAETVGDTTRAKALKLAVLKAAGRA